MSIVVDQIVDAKGLSCPMPIVKTKKALEGMEAGQVVEVQATDRGSLADIQGFAKTTGHHYLGSLDEDGVLKHYLRKANLNERKEETTFTQVIHNDELLQKLNENANIKIIDVREPAEFAFGHIPGAFLIPYHQLEANLGQFSKDEEYYLICRTGNRSDYACQLLQEKGITNVKNVIPGMSQWQGPVEKI